MTAVRITVVLAVAATFAPCQIRPLIPTPSEVRLGVFAGREVTYQIIGGLAITDGDIVFDRAATSSKNNVAGAIADNGKLWTLGVIPYTVDAAVKQPDRITRALAEWTAKTPLRFVERTNQVNYLKFLRSAEPGACNSWVGMIGGGQEVNLGDQCSDLAAIHEIGHAIGLWHEQARNDRDQYIRVRFDNVNLPCVHNFDKYLETGKESSPYDYASAMQYYPYAFSRNGLPTIETIPAGIPIGTGTRLSAIDADAASRIYGRVATATTISTFPEGLQVTVDGVTLTGTSTLNWADGSVHTIGVPDTQGDSNERYVFARWSDGGAQSHSVTASRDARVFTVALVHQYRSTVTALTGGRVTLSPAAADGFYTDGSFVTMTATPDAGFNFSGWNNLDVDETGRLTFIYQNNYFGYGPQNPRTYEVNRARAITVSFTSQPVLTIQTEPPNLRYKLDGNEILAPQILTSGRITIGQNHTLTASAQLDCRTLCITGTRYLFQDFADSPTQTRTFNWDGKSNVTYTLRFKTQHQQTFLSQNPGLGSVSVEARPADDFYDEGSTVKLTATPSAANRFVSWQNGLLSTDLAASVTASVVSSCGNPWLYAVRQPLTLYGSFAVPPNPAPKPALLANGVFNSASGQGAAVSPGAILALYGTDLGPAALKALAPGDAGYFDNCAAGTSVTFDGIPAPMIYASQTQLGAIVPYSVAGKSTVNVQVRNQGVLSNTVSVPVQAATPALFTANGSGTGQGAIFNQDGSYNGAPNPAARGSIVVLFATGEGQTNPAGTDGRVAVDTYPKPVLPVKVSIGGVDAEVLYYGAAPYLVAGAMQVNARVPAGIATGAAALVLSVGSFNSRAGVTVSVQ